MVDWLFLLPVKNKISSLFFVMLLPALLALSCAPQPAGLTPSPGQKSPEVDWLNIQLKDVLTDRPFKLADFKGKVVVLETMAVWCTTCTRQQIEIRKAHSQWGDDVISVSLDIDPNEDGALLRKYAKANGFNWPFAISPPELSQQLEKMFGAAILNPPSTPVVIIDRDQSARLLKFGLKSTRELVAEISRRAN